MQKYVNLVDLVNTVPRFTCRNRRRYSWDRASHTLEVIEFILSFASLTISLHGPAEHWMCPADVSVQALHCSMNGSFDHCFTARWAPYRSCTKKRCVRSLHRCTMDRWSRRKDPWLNKSFALFSLNAPCQYSNDCTDSCHLRGLARCRTG